MNIEQFKQLFPLPDNWIYSTILLIIFGLVPFGVKSLLPLTRICSALSEARNRKILMEQLSRGSYDKETIHQSTKFYISPKCSNIDPAQEEEMRQALMATRESLFNKIDYFIDHDSSKRHLLVLADSGTGKTSLVLNYYAYNLRKRGRKSQSLFLVYLGFKDADNQIRVYENKSEAVIFLDALDEDTKAIENHHMRIRELMEICREFKRVIITCRSQFFPSDEEVPVETGIARLGPRKAGERGVYEFWKLYLSPFDDSDIKLYLQRRFPIWRLGDRKKATEIAYQIKSLSARPMLLAHIPDVVKSNIRITQTCQLYQLMVDAWLQRESSWVKESLLKEYSERLSVNLYVFREKRGMERIPYDVLVQLAYNWKIDLGQWQLSGRSLLNRDAQGNYKFAHRSIMEFLFINRLLQRDTDCCGIILTDQMKSFLIERILPQDANRDLKAAFKFLVKNEVFVNYQYRLPSDGANASNVDADILEDENGDTFSSKEKFLESLDYASELVYLYSRILQSSLPIYSPTYDRIDELRESLLDRLDRQIDSYRSEILGLAFPGLSALPSDDIRRIGIINGDHFSQIYQRPSNDLRKAMLTSSGNLQDNDPTTSCSIPPKEIQQDIRNYIKQYGRQGLISYHLINDSGLCFIRPVLPSLHQFELVLKPQLASHPASLRTS